MSLLQIAAMPMLVQPPDEIMVRSTHTIFIL
jgi:hypothetical protein